MVAPAKSKYEPKRLQLFSLKPNLRGKPIYGKHRKGMIDTLMDFELYLQAFKSAEQRSISFYMTILIIGNNIEHLNEFPTTLENKLTNEKMVIESDRFDDFVCVKIVRVPLNSTLSYEEMCEIKWKWEKLSRIYINMV